MGSSVLDKLNKDMKLNIGLVAGSFYPHHEEYAIPQPKDGSVFEVWEHSEYCLSTILSDTEVLQSSEDLKELVEKKNE